MSLAEKLKTVTPAPTGLPCGVSKLMESMNKTDKEALDDALFNYLTQSGQRLSNSKIYQILTDEGYDVAVSSIAQHRRKQCRCFVGAAARTKGTK
jgi:hypothetical protein